MATVPTLIVPSSLWAWPRLRRAGVVRYPEEALCVSGAAAGLPLPALVAHVLARLLVLGCAGGGLRALPDSAEHLERQVDAIT